MSTQPQQPQPQPAHGNSTSTSSNASASDGVESVRKSEPGTTVDQSHEVQSTEVQSNEVQVPSTGANPNPNNPEVPFKERVIGVAKKTRGTILNKPEVKEHGERILQGRASVYDATGRSVS
ncbi:hypothetical protein F5879DRAFT_954095 [Lentinula edodes]|nr:hypothetical protein F5879DRAFT_954095 [Lentinula edodes]